MPTSPPKKIIPAQGIFLKNRGHLKRGKVGKDNCTVCRRRVIRQLAKYHTFTTLAKRDQPAHRSLSVDGSTTQRLLQRVTIGRKNLRGNWRTHLRPLVFNHSIKDFNQEKSFLQNQTTFLNHCRLQPIRIVNFDCTGKLDLPSIRSLIE